MKYALDYQFLRYNINEEILSLLFTITLIESISKWRNNKKVNNSVFVLRAFGQNNLYNS